MTITTVYLPGDSAAASVGAHEVAVALEREAALAGKHITLVRNGTRGMLWLEPLVEIDTDRGRVGYGPVNAEDVGDLIAAGMLDGAPHALCQGVFEDLPWMRDATRGGVHDLPLPHHRRQRRHHRQLRLGDQLPRIQSHRRASRAAAILKQLRHAGHALVFPCQLRRTEITMAAPPEIRLANEIAAQFRNLPLEHGAAAIATHVLNFWDPRMRAGLVSQATQAGDECDALIAAAAPLVEYGLPLKPWGG